MQLFDYKIFKFAENKFNKHIYSSLTYWNEQFKEQKILVNRGDNQLNIKKNDLQTDFHHKKDWNDTTNGTSQQTPVLQTDFHHKKDWNADTPPVVISDPVLQTDFHHKKDWNL